MMLIQLSYVSTCKTGLQKNDFTSMLEKAIYNNNILQISGILVYCNGSFFQILEGEKDDVIMMFNKILLDYRHENIIKLSQIQITERNFAKWSMAFKSYNKNLQSLDNFNDEQFKAEVTGLIEKYNSTSLKLLNDFYELNAF